jgi:hypothetical protein
MMDMLHVRGFHRRFLALVAGMATVIVGLDIAADYFGDVGDRGEAASTYGLASDDAEEDLHQVQSGSDENKPSPQDSLQDANNDRYFASAHCTKSNRREFGEKVFTVKIGRIAGGCRNHRPCSPGCRQCRG